MLLSQTQFHQLEAETAKLPLNAGSGRGNFSEMPSASSKAVARPDHVPVNNERTRRNQLQLLKLYYNRDAAESVTKSLLMLHDDLDTLKLNESSSLSSASSVSIPNSKYASEQQRQQQQQAHYQQHQQQVSSSSASFESSHSSPAPSSAAAHSCLLFLSDLVEKQQAAASPGLQDSLPIGTIDTEDKEEVQRANSTLLQSHLEKIFKANSSLKTLKNKSSSYLTKRFSLKARAFDATDSGKSKLPPIASEPPPKSHSTSSRQRNQARVDQLVNGHSNEISNSSSSCSNSNSNSNSCSCSNCNVSSSNLSWQSSQVHFNQQLKQTVNKEASRKGECESKKSSSGTQDQRDYSGAASKMSSYANSKQQQQQHVSYNNSNLYNQNELLSKKLRKLLPNNMGLRNHGNTCFMNCILQCLFHTSPLADFFVTEQFEQDMQVIAHQHKAAAAAATGSATSGSPQFVLTKHFYRLLNSMWRNTYESSYSQELKQVIGHFNSTFSGGNQNDSHELCVWLLDRLSQELSLKLPSRLCEAAAPKSPPSSGKPPAAATITSSFVEELFQIEFKSTVICSQCNYQSSKYENDMMLSLPLPQNQARETKPVVQRQQQRRSLYPHLILANQASIRGILAESAQSDRAASPSKSKFYVASVPSADAAGTYSTPFHVKVGCNIQINCGGDQAEPATSSSSGGGDPLDGFSITNPSLADFREYISSCYQLRANDLVFVNLSHIEKNLTDEQSIKEAFFVSSPSKPATNTTNTTNTASRSAKCTDSLVDSMCIMELSSLSAPSSAGASQQLPLINIIGINVYQDQQSSSRSGLVCHGLPFVLVINRDCSYSQLCRQLLEAQSKYFKDNRGLLKYKDLVEKLFTLSLSSDSLQPHTTLNAADELPLYAECVEQALNDSQLNSHSNEFIKLHIEWKSFDGIANLFKDMDYGKADFEHKSVRHLHKFDSEQQQHQQQQHQGSSKPSPRSVASQAAHSSSSQSATVSTATLDDCFELFTEQEHLTDENSWLCPQCQKQTSAYKNLVISQAPPILIIHLKRFFYKSKTSNFKLTTPVWFPVNSLDITKHVDPKQQVANGNDSLVEYDSSDPEADDSNSVATDSAKYGPQRTGVNENYMYDLVGVANHKGANMANGHYTAFCKNLVDTKWYCFDDATCTPMVEGTATTTAMGANSNIFNNGSGAVWTENAYILFYKKRNCMRNERWWTSYVDRALYEYDEFDRFLHNLDQIELEQKRNQESLQAQQLRVHRHPSTHAQIVSKDNLNSVAAATATKKSTGLNKIRSMLSSSSGSHNGRHRDTMADFDETGNGNGSYCSSHSSSSQSQQDVRIEVRHYDEQTKPKRLLKQTSQRREGASPTKTNSAGPSTPSHVASRVPRAIAPAPVPAPTANAITSQCNLLTLNAITDLPSSDSNNSLDNSSSSFVYSRREPSHTNNSKSNCFKTQVEPFEADHYYERKTTDSTRLSNESSQSLLYRYPADNDYNFRPATATAINASSNASPNRSSNSEFLVAKKSMSHSSRGSSIHEYQPRHHHQRQPVPASSIYLTTASAQKKPQKGHSQSSSSNRRVSPSTSHSTTSPKSPQPANGRSDSRTNHASRYINSSSIETPI